MSVACPADERECRQLLSTAFEQDHPVAVRYPRGAGVGVAPLADWSSLPFGKGELRRAGQRVAILAFGTLLYPALEAAERLDATVVNMRWAKPLDLELLLQAAAGHEALVTVEDGCHHGRRRQRRGRGAGRRRRGQAAAAAGPARPLHRARRPGAPAGAGGLDATGIENAIRRRFGALVGAAGELRAVAGQN
jgi:1-deoxy-D-xylulose-5-phosphate synthase